VRKSWIQLYAPFLVLMMVQAMFIAVSPSRGPGQQELNTAGLSSGPGGDVDAGGAEVAVDSSGVPIAEGGGAVAGAAGTRSTGPGGVTGGTSAGGGRLAAAAGDTSHCKEGMQVKLIVVNPAPCVPKFSGDNGGATYQGVNKDTIKVIRVTSIPSALVNAALAPKGLATSQEDSDAFDKVAWDFLQKHYETYGRKIAWENVELDCKTTPPDYDKCNAAAQEVVKRKPALVIWITSLYASVFDIWAKAGIPSIGGSAFDEKFYEGRRPYRYDIAMDGTEAAGHIGEYYCKKMAGKNVSHSGTVVHPEIGNRNAVKRKLGIIVPDIEANVLTAKAVASKVKACGGGDVLLSTYASNIETATQQAQDTVTTLIQNKVTSVTCMCDPIAPAFFTKGMTDNQYYPEFLLPGLGLLDYDLLGQLYSAPQMQHAFGPSHLSANNQVPLDDTDAALVWRAMGKSGHPCGNNGCGLNWAFINAAGIAIQAAGPNYNPLNLERGMLSLPPSNPFEPKRNPKGVLYKYGPGDYTGTSDVREVYWSATTTARQDNSSGAYIATNGGARYELGKWPSNGLSAIPVATQ